MVKKDINRLSQKNNIKKILSGTLLCTMLLNCFVPGISANEIQFSKAKTGKEGISAVQQSDSTAEDASEEAIDSSGENYLEDTSTGQLEADSSVEVIKPSETIEDRSTTLETEESFTVTDSTTASQEISQSTEETANQQSTEDVEVGQQGTNHKKGTYAMQSGGISLRAASVIDKVYANNPNLPGKHFIDVASWNGNISVAEYQKIKSYGVTSVSVKLTEGTSYTNPYAENQINNAKAAGLTVSAYHYSLYTSAQTAQAEANYFADAANRLGLNKNTIMFNDAEDPTLINNGRDAHNNSLAFNRQLQAKGFSNAALYIGKYWITNGYINTSAFGKDRVWVAQYPYSPDQSMQWNNDHGAWQWSSNMHFPGIANFENRPFDISMSYSSFFSAPNPGPDLTNYYTTNPGRVILKQNDRFYEDINFTSPASAVPKNSVVTIKSIQTTANGIPRLFTDKGYLTANKNYVIAANSNLDSYYIENPKLVRTKADDYFYSDLAFTQPLNKIAKDTIVKVEDLEVTKEGIFRLKTNQGYLTANKSYVQQVVANIANYYSSNPGKVVLKQDDYYYKDLSFTQRGEVVLKDTVVEITGIEYTNEGVPRLKTNKGYLTANKTYVQQLTANIENYYMSNPGKVALKHNDHYYKDLSFTQRGEVVTQGTVIDIVGIEFTNEGIPRLKTAKGYLTANKAYVQQVVANIANYYSSNPGKVVLKQDDYYYKDLSFTQRGEVVLKDTVVEITGIEYTNEGVPRLKTNKGYLTANKTYVQQLTANIENYYMSNPGKVALKHNDYYYKDLSFTQRGEVVTQGTVIDIVGIEFTNEGIPRLKTAKGYLTANKAYVQQVVANITNYYSSNPGKVVLKQDDYYYKDLSFTQRGEVVAQGTVVDVMGIEFTNEGIPRLKTAKGYLTANKVYVQQVAANIANYYTSNPGKVILKHNDYYYKDLSFTQRGEAVSKGTVAEIKGIEFTNEGVPRLKTAKGYLTANKAFVGKI